MNDGERVLNIKVTAGAGQLFYLDVSAINMRPDVYSVLD